MDLVYTDAWVKRKLGEIAIFINGRAYLQDELLSKGKYKILRVGNFYTNNNWYYSNMELDKKYYALEGDLLYTWSATFGPHIWHGEKVIYHYHIWKIELSEQLCKSFAFQILELDKSKLLSDSNGSTMIHITKKGIEENIIFLPVVAEQSTIGNFFHTLDTIITLYQQKLEKLKELKKGYLQKMFPKKTEKLSRFRFKVFCEMWKKQKLYEVTEKLKSYSLSRDVECKKRTGYRYIHYGDIHKQVADLITCDEQLPNIKIGNYLPLKQGDLALADASEDYMGISEPCLILHEPSDKIIAGLHTIALRPRNASSIYLYYMLHTYDFKKYCVHVGTGLKVFGITNNNLSQYETKFPIIAEQNIIGSFFLVVDNQINILSTKIEQLIKIKNFYLTKMFI